MAPSSAPPLFVIKGHALLEAALVNQPDVIDFGLDGPQISSSQFVGVRYVGLGIEVESRKATSHDQNRNGQNEHFRREEYSGRRSPALANGNDIDVHTWELVWKDGKARDSLRRLKFVTTDSGFRQIQNKLDAWASASNTSSAMNEAAKAALDACGGHLKENRSAQESATDHFVPAKLMDDAAVDHIVAHDTMAGLERVPTADEPESEKYMPVRYVFDLVGAPQRGNIIPRRDSASSILQDYQIMAIASVLPVRFRSYNWTLLYSTARDGISLNTLYRKVHMNGPTILAVRDFQRRIFGCYTSEEWKAVGRSYGTGECFVFQIVPDMKAYKWTRTNSMFMYSNLDMLAIGGGDHYSILLNSDLLTGYSGACETFGSPPLAISEEFDVSSIEVWGFRQSYGNDFDG